MQLKKGGKMIKNYKELTLYLASFLLILFLTIIFTLIFTGCTISVTTLHTQGTASDVVDEQQTSTPTVNASAEIPLIN